MKRSWIYLVAALTVSQVACRHSELPEDQASELRQQAADPETVSRVSGFGFVNIAAEAGVRFAYRNGEQAGHCAILETLGGGVAYLDFDGDGLDDLCFTGGGQYAGREEMQGNKVVLFRNAGELQFETVPDSAIGTPASFYNHGVSTGDFNNDGFQDLLVTGYGRVQLLQNNGDGTFTDVARQSGLVDDGWSTSAAWGDIDGDGNLDLYIVHYVDWSFENDPFCSGPNGQRDNCGPKEFSALSDRLFSSNGDGTFSNASVSSGLVEGGKGLGVLIADFDVDGDVDIYVANDTTENFYYENDGTGRLSEIAVPIGTATDDTGVPNGSMGVALCDYNRDGNPDIWVTNFEREAFALYRNEGERGFVQASRISGVTALGGLFVGFGTVVADFDLDGDEDIVTANGHIVKFPRHAPRRQLPLLLSNDKGRFSREKPQGSDYFSNAWEGRGLATGDLDNDGDLDVSVSHINDPVAILENKNQSGGWLTVTLVGRWSNRSAIGARAILDTSGGQILRQLQGGGSYLSSSQQRLHWGLEENIAVHGLTIVWPSGVHQRIKDVRLNQHLQLIEPRGNQD